MSAFEDALRSVLPDYEVPDDDLVGEVLIPAMSTADEVRIGAGFFSSACFAQIAPGLAAFIGRTSEPLKLLISPKINLADRDAIERGVKSAEDVLRETTVRLFEDARLSAAAIVKHTLDCLAWLVAAQRLDVRFVLMKRGMYHKKKWLFRSGETWLAVHGSGNATTRGLLVNGEQMTIDRSWTDGEAAALRIERLVRQWERQWNNEHPHSLTLLAPQALDLVGRSRSTTHVPTVDDFWESWRADHAAGLEPPLPPNIAAAPAPLLMIPPDLEWRTGRYRHQGAAVDGVRSCRGPRRFGNRNGRREDTNRADRSDRGSERARLSRRRRTRIRHRPALGDSRSARPRAQLPVPDAPRTVIGSSGQSRGAFRDELAWMRRAASFYALAAFFASRKPVMIGCGSGRCFACGT
jgi:hypothetical protein